MNSLGDLSSPNRIKPMPWAVKVQSLDHRTSGEFPVDWNLLIVALFPLPNPFPSFLQRQCLARWTEGLGKGKDIRQNQINRSSFQEFLHRGYGCCMHVGECGSGLVLWGKKVYQRREGNSIPAERRRERDDHIISTASLLSLNLLFLTLKPMNHFLFRLI